MSETLRSILVGTAGLSVAAVVALAVTLARGGIEGTDVRLRATVRLASVAVVLQAAHFAEELATDFHRRFPETLGLAPWSLTFFLSLNFFWLAVWVVSLRGLAARRRVALFPLWFLGIAGVVNGLGHPLLSLRGGGYFPGLVTSPFIGVAGVLLLRGLSAVTAAHNGSADREPVAP